MQVTLIHNSDTRKTLEIVFPAPLVDTAFKAALEKITPRVKMPGFRPGKAPKSVLISRYKSEIAREVAEKLIESHFQGAVDAIDLHPITRPALESAELREGVDGTVKVQFDVAPEVKLPEYKGLVLIKKKRRVDDEYIARTLESMREKAARYIPVEDGAAPGHIVKLDTKIKPKGMKARINENQEMRLREGRPFDAEIMGMKVDEEKKFTLQIPEDDENYAFAGKQVYYEVFVSDIWSEAVPELNDEFAKDAGDYESLQALKDSLRKDLEESAEKDALVRLQSDILDMLLDASSFEVPSSMVNLQLDDYCREFIEKLNQIGFDYKKIDWKNYRQSRLNDAERAVRSGYLLQALGNAEDIQVSDEEIDQEIRKWMEESRTGESFDAVRANFEKHGATTEIRGRVRTDKIFDMILNSAAVTEEILDSAAYDDLLEMERRRKEGIAQARFDAGGLEGGDFEEQEGGGPDAVMSAEDPVGPEAPPEADAEPPAEEGRAAGEAAEIAEAGEVAETAEVPEINVEEAPPVKRGRPKKADAAPKEEPETEEATPDAAPAKRGRPKKADAPPGGEPETEEAPPDAPPVKRGRPKKADAEESSGADAGNAEKPKRARKKTESEG
ncbi:MAG: trigger factor [Holophagales bacterium]|jgi:trigger factor|nr:trigger factor [Holophagales bacterium]